MIKAAILDDKLNEVNLLQTWLEEHSMVSFMGSFSSANVLLPEINTVELLFCDIEMPEINGFEFLRILKQAPDVVFISSHGEYALDSFEFEPIHFIQKPIEKSKVLEAIERMRQKKNMGELCERDFFFIKTGNNDYQKISFSDILFISALDDYVQIHLEKSRVTTYTRLKEIKKRLPSSFIQSHRSFLVNLNKVRSVNSKDIELENGMEIPISNSYRAEIKKQLN